MILYISKILYKGRGDIMFKRKREYLIPVLGFLFIILVGAIILYLPCCTIGTANFIDTLFTSTSATTTTGFFFK